jgi:hypothetical protein
MQDVLIVSGESASEVPNEERHVDREKEWLEEAEDRLLRNCGLSPLLSRRKTKV